MKQLSQLNLVIGIMHRLHHQSLLHRNNHRLDPWAGSLLTLHISNQCRDYWNWSNWWVNWKLVEPFSALILKKYMFAFNVILNLHQISRCLLNHCAKSSITTEINMQFNIIINCACTMYTVQCTHCVLYIGRLIYKWN